MQDGLHMQSKLYIRTDSIDSLPIHLLGILCILEHPTHLWVHLLHHWTSTTSNATWGTSTTSVDILKHPGTSTSSLDIYNLHEHLLKPLTSIAFLEHLLHSWNIYCILEYLLNPWITMTYNASFYI